MSMPELESLVALAREDDLAPFIARARELEPADLADVLAALDDDERLHVVRSLPPELSAEALVEMPHEAHAEDTLAALEPERAAEIVEELDSDDAADLLGEMEPEDQERILSEVEDPSEVERLLTYDEETAGGRMNPRVISVHDTATAGEAIEEIRRQSEEVEDFYEVYVVDDRRVLRGLLPMKSLVVSPTDRPVRAIMEEPTVSVLPETDQEEVARLMSRYNLPAVPVVDAGGHLLGSITFDDVVDVVEAETTEDILRFGGVSADEELGAGWRDSVRSRLPWLLLNLLTAFVAGAVVYANHTTIERIVLLAAWMPIIAGMGGNTGTQALAVTVFEEHPPFTNNPRVARPPSCSSSPSAPRTRAVTTPAQTRVTTGSAGGRNRGTAPGSAGPGTGAGAGRGGGAQPCQQAMAPRSVRADNVVQVEGMLDAGT